MGKHSLSPEQSKNEPNPWTPDHSPFDYEKELKAKDIEYSIELGGRSKITLSPIKLALWGLIPLSISVVLLVLLKNDVHIEDSLLKISSLITFGFYGNAFLVLCRQMIALRTIRKGEQEPKNFLPLGSLLGFPGFLLILTGLFWSSDLGILSGIFITIGSMATISGYILLRKSKPSTKRVGWKQVLTVLMFLPFSVGLLGILGMTIAVFTEFFG